MHAVRRDSLGGHARHGGCVLMPSPDTIATIILVAVALLAALAVCLTEPGGAARMVRTGHHTAVWLDAQGVPEQDRHYRPALPAPAPLPALETAPDPVVSPFAARTA